MLKLFLLLMLAAVSVAQSDSPVQAKFLVDDRVMVSIHEDKSWSAVMVDDSLNTVSSYQSVAPGQQQRGTPPPPPNGEGQIKTTWKDREGVEHTVTTPVIGTDQAAVDAAARAHLLMVNTMLGIFPPRPAPTGI